MLKQSITAITLASAIMLAILLFTTTPSSAGPLVVLIFFVLMYLLALGVLTFLFRCMSMVSARVLPKKYAGSSAGGLSFRKSYYYASVMALAPIMLIAIHSVGQLGVYQILLVIFFVVIAWVYVSNRSA